MIQSKKALFFAFLFPITSLLAFTAYRKYLQLSGIEVILPISGHDPRSILSGHYLIYEIDYGINNICASKENKESYVCLEPKSFSYSEPSNCKKLIKGKCKRDRFHAGVEMFFIPEKFAQALDQEIRTKPAKIVLSLAKNGLAQVKDLLIEGQSWKIRPATSTETRLYEDIPSELQEHSPSTHSETVTEVEVTELELANEDLSDVDLSNLTHPLPVKLITGEEIAWHEPFEATEGVDRPKRRRSRSSSFEDSADQKSIIIWGESKLKIDRITKDKDYPVLYLSDERDRKFSIPLKDWLKTQHTSHRNRSVISQLQTFKDGVPVVFNNCMEKIGELKNKCFEISYPKDFSFENCPQYEGFPQYISESLKTLCGYVKDPTVTLEKTLTDDRGNIYVIKGNLETLYHILKFKIAEIETSRMRFIEVNSRINTQKEVSANAPYQFARQFQALKDEGKTEEIDRIISETQKAKGDDGNSLLDKYMSSQLFNAKDIVLQNQFQKGDWSLALDHYIAPEWNRRILTHDFSGKDYPAEILFLKTLFTSDYNANSSIRKSPELAKQWEAFVTKHKFLEIKAHYDFYNSPIQGATDHAAALVKKLGLDVDIKKISSISKSSAKDPAFSDKEILALVSKYPYASNFLPQRFRIDGKGCEHAIEAELNSRYFANGVCRLIPLHHIHDSTCIPRAKYPPNGEGYYDKCRENFRIWVRKTYPEHFK